MQKKIAFVVTLAALLYNTYAYAQVSSSTTFQLNGVTQTGTRIVNFSGFTGSSYSNPTLTVVSGGSGSSVTLSTTSPLRCDGGGSCTLGTNRTLSCPTCLSSTSAFQLNSVTQTASTLNFGSGFTGSLAGSTLSITGVSGSAISGLVPSTAYGVYVPEWSSSNPAQQIAHGQFWPPGGTALGTAFFWQMLVKPINAGSRYIVSDGAGGAHALLAGFTQVAPDTENFPGGNVNSTSGAQTFNADDGCFPNEWCWVAYSLANGFLYTYVDGVPVGRSTFAGTRQSCDYSAGACGDLFVGGSDHNNFDGAIANICAFDSSNPQGTLELAYTPKFPCEPQAYNVAGTYTPIDFGANYVSYGGPTPWTIYDYSPVGRSNGTVLRFHPGILWGSGNGTLRGWGTAPSTYPRPIYTQATTFPYQTPSTTPTPSLVALTPAPSTPVGAKVFDSFTRQNSTWAWSGTPWVASTAYEQGILVINDSNKLYYCRTAGTSASSGGPTGTGTAINDGTIVWAYVGTGGYPTLGYTESGSLGQLPWQYGAFDNGFTSSYWGVLRQRARFLHPNGSVRGSAWVDVGATDMTVSVTRRPGSFGGFHIALTIRQCDRLNFWNVETFGATGTGQTIRVRKFVAGVESGPDAAMPSDYSGSPANWTVLTVGFTGSTMTISTDGNLRGTLTSQTSLSSCTGAGLYTPTVTGSPGVEALDSWDNFTVL